VFPSAGHSQHIGLVIWRHQWKNGLSPHFGQLFLGNLFLWLSSLFVCALHISMMHRHNRIVSLVRYKNLAIANRSRVSCAHYVEGINDNPVTLKSRLTVTQGHWKRNYWVDHTWLTISRVIGRWILLWPWDVDQRSLKVIEVSAIGKLGCGFLFAFYSNYGRISSRLWDIQCQTMAWPWKPG